MGEVAPVRSSAGREQETKGITMNTYSRPPHSPDCCSSAPSPRPRPGPGRTVTTARGTYMVNGAGRLRRQYLQRDAHGDRPVWRHVTRSGSVTKTGPGHVPVFPDRHRTLRRDRDPLGHRRRHPPRYRAERQPSTRFRRTVSGSRRKRRERAMRVCLGFLRWGGFWGNGPFRNARRRAGTSPRLCMPARRPLPHPIEVCRDRSHQPCRAVSRRCASFR